MRITANDTAWRTSWPAKYRDWDLRRGVPGLGVAVARAARAAVAAHPGPRPGQRPRGFPLRWGLPLVNGERLRLVEPRAGRQARARTAPTRSWTGSPRRWACRTRATIPDPVRRVVRAALRNRWTVLLQGPPGCGKTELVRETVRAELGRDPLYFSLPVTNVEDLCAPIPTADGTLDNLLAASVHRAGAEGDRLGRVQPPQGQGDVRQADGDHPGVVAGRPADRESAGPGRGAEPAVPPGPQAAGGPATTSRRRPGSPRR